MPRRRRSSGWGYFPLVVLLLLLLLMVTGVLQVRISPRVNLPPQVQVPSEIQAPNLNVLIAELTHAISQDIPGLQINIPAVTPVPNNPAAAPPPGIGQRTKTSGCVSQGSLPDSACTPGAVFNVTREQICVPGYSSSVRDVPISVKDQVYAEYGIAQHREGEYEVDHLVPLELGGSNNIANLWPEPASPSPGFHEKDQVENYMHDQVCNGAVPLQQAQDEIASNWLKTYEQMTGR